MFVTELLLLFHLLLTQRLNHHRNVANPSNKLSLLESKVLDTCGFFYYTIILQALAVSCQAIKWCISYAMHKPRQRKRNPWYDSVFSLMACVCVCVSRVEWEGKVRTKSVKTFYCWFKPFRSWLELYIIFLLLLLKTCEDTQVQSYYFGLDTKLMHRS